MAITYTDNGTNTPNGTHKIFTYSFPVLQTEDIKVALNGIVQATTKYTASLSPAQIEFNSTNADATVQNTSTGAPLSGVLVRVYRQTTVGKNSGDEDPKAVFAAGSSIRATDLNANQEQALFAIHELQNQEVLEEKIGTGAVTSSKILDGTIVNADISSTAEIAVNKLQDGSARQLLQTAANGADVEWSSNIDIPGTLDVTGNADIDSNLNVDGTLTVASAVDFNNDLDVDGNTNLDNTTIDGYINVTGVATVDNVRIDGNEVRAHSGNLELDSQSGTVTVDDNLNVTGNITWNGTFNNLTTTEVAILDGATLSTTELNTLDGITASTTELNKLDGVTASTGEINKLDGVTATTGEINKLSGLTSTTTELNILDGVTASATELNTLDGITATTSELNILDGVTATTAEINTLDGVTATAAELNLNDGQTATAADVNILDGATVTTAEINKLDGYTGSTADLNEVVAGKNVVETISGTATDAQIPTAQAVNERITTVVSDVGGFVPIANETSFPTANPDLDNAAGTIVSIKALNSSFTTGSGVTTHTISNGAGSGKNVTITGLTQLTTYSAGRGLILETTQYSGGGRGGDANEYEYAFHRLTLDETGVASAQTAINDFNHRYYGPLGSEPSTRPNNGGARVQGDLYFSTVDNQMKVWNNAASQWDDVASSASSNIVTLTPAFNNSETEFTCSTVPVDAQSLLLSINGVIQKPNSGTSTPSEGYVKLANGKIKLASAPATGAPYFAIALGNTVSIGTPSPDTVGATELKDGEIANVHVSSSAAIQGSKISPDFGSQNIVTTGSITGNDLEIDSGTLSVDASNNRVGIGTTSPSTTLNVTGTAAQAGIFQSNQSATTISVLDTDGDGLNISGGSTYGHRIHTNNTEKLELGVNNSTKLVIDTSGRVGIGTTAPESGYNLEIHGSGAPTLRIKDTDVTNSWAALSHNHGASYILTRSNTSFGTFQLYQHDGTTLKTTLNVQASGQINHLGPLIYTKNNAANPYDSSLAVNDGAISIRGDLGSGNYWGWRQRATADGSISTSNKTKVLPSINDFQYPNDSNGLLIASTSKIGFAASAESPQYANGVQMLFDSDGLAFGSGNAFDNTHSSTTSANANVVIRTNGSIDFKSSTSPLNWKANGRDGTYNQSVMYAHQNNTSGSTSNGIVFEVGRLTDSSTAEIGKFTIATRGGQISALFDANGLKFGGDTASANGLNDYEEGTWTPVLLASSTAFTTAPSYSVRYANYTKIGRQVHCDCYVSWNNDGAGGAGHVRLGGLPFTEGGHGTYPGVYYGFYDINSSLLNENEDFLGYVQNSANYIVLYKGNNAGNSNILNVATMCNNANGNFQMSFTYMT